MLAFLMRKLSVNNKLVLGILSISVLVTGVAFIMIIFNYNGRMKEILENSTQLTSNLVGEYSVSALSFSNSEAAKSNLDKLSMIGNITNAYIYDSTGTLFASYSNKANANLFVFNKMQIDKDSSFHDGNFFVTIKKVINNDIHYGYVELVTTKDEIQGQVRNYYIFMCMLMLSVAFISYYLAKLIRKPITMPITELAEITKRIADGDDLDFEIKPRNNQDEIATLYRSFAKMIEQIKNKQLKQIEAEQKLKKLNEDLEDTINRRTILLEATVAQLKTEIAEKEVITNELIIAKEDLAASLENEKEINEIKSRFVSMISHEYKTPLTVILSSLSLIPNYVHPLKPDAFNKHYTRIQDAVDKLQALLNDVLMLGKIDMPTSISPEIDFELNSMINDIIEERKIIDEANHVFVFNSFNPKIKINFDKTALYHILGNLISNAIKYSPAGAPVLININRDSNGLEFEICDSGIGISPELEKNIFEPFQRGMNVSDISGTGLGLSIVKRIVEKLNGTINYSSAINQGTRFIVYLPIEINED